MVKVQQFQAPVDGYVQRWIDDAANGVWRQPFPGEVTIAEDEMMRNFKRLEEFVWLEERTRRERNANAKNQCKKGRTLHAGRLMPRCTRRGHGRD